MNFDLMPNPFTRREFLRSSLVLASAAAALPSFISRSAIAMQPAAGLSSIPGVPEDRVLVIIQLSGGNDGLNTVVPYGQSTYYNLRPGINIPENQALKLDNVRGVGLHPQLGPIKELYDSGLCSIVQGVGYPNPNRSHFKSMDIWHTADLNGTGDGWLGRYFDAECCGFGKGESGTAEKAKPNGQPGVAIGRTAPLAMQGRRSKPISFESEELFRWIGQDVERDLTQPYDALQRREAAGDDSAASFLMRTALDAQVSSDMIRKAVRSRPLVPYPNSELARQLAMVAAMIRAGLPTRVYYVSHGGFDTHAQQGGPQGRHAQLLSQFAQATKAFYADLKAQRNESRVLTMSFSEFGRRVGQNASGGTDHGTAAPMFFFGPMVRAGVLTEHPALNELDDGDLRYRVDFRSVYAGVLKDWLKADPVKVLEGSFEVAPLIKKA